MKFISVHHWDQTTDLWSNTPRSIIEALRALGHEVVLINHLLPRSTPLLSIKRRLHQYLFGKVYHTNRDPRMSRARAAGLNRRIADLGPADAVLFTFLPDAAYVQTPYPVILIHDSTWISTLDYYSPRSMFAKETIAGGIELDTLALQRCTTALFTSKWAADSAVRDYGIPSAKLHVAPLGAGLDPPPDRVEVAASIASRGRVPMKLLFVGQVWDRKGGDAAVAVCRSIESQGVPVELHVVGCEPPAGAPSFIHRHSRLDKSVPAQKQMFYDLFRACDYFILPTRAEAFGIVFAEAAAFGLPVLTSDTGGVTSVVSPEWSLALPVDSPAADFAAWAIENFRDRAAYERMAWAARNDFEQRLNWKAFAQVIVDLAAENRTTSAPRYIEAA
jgi:glycosyltransferase involved in cell wall biosynthesis